ncbi:MAG: hypothetical protein AB1733_19275 [Thermodesulfobacteriota bacterium]
MSEVPEAIRDVFNELKKEVQWLHARWLIYRQLFGHSERRIELLNESASVFFFVIEEVLVDEVQVSLSKLTDPARTRRHENLSLEQLHERVCELDGQGLSSRLREILDNLHEQCRGFRIRRNRRLAHLDLRTGLQQGATPLPGVSREMIAGALSLVRDYMNTIEGHYCESETGYENVIMTRQDGEALVLRLRNGLRYSELVRNGTISRQDWLEDEWRDA